MVGPGSREARRATSPGGCLRRLLAERRYVAYQSPESSRGEIYVRPFPRVDVSASGPTFSAGKPATVFETKYVQSNPSRHYDVSADGQRFLMIKDGPANPNEMPASLVVVEHWLEELRQRVPTTTLP